MKLQLATLTASMMLLNITNVGLRNMWDKHLCEKWYRDDKGHIHLEAVLGRAEPTTAKQNLTVQH